MLRPMTRIAVFLALGLVLAGSTWSGEAPSKVYAGVITKVDLDNRSLTLKDAQAGEIILQVPDSAVIVLDGDEEAILDDLFEGDEVKEASVKTLEGGGLQLVKAVVTSQVDEPGEGEEEQPEEGSTAP